VTDISLNLSRFDVKPRIRRRHGSRILRNKKGPRQARPKFREEKPEGLTARTERNQSRAAIWFYAVNRQQMVNGVEKFSAPAENFRGQD
jgi:hypothetical protein